MRALVEARRRSIARVIVAPMPTAGPLIAAMTGFGSAWIARVTLPPVSRIPSYASRSARSSSGVGRMVSSSPKTLPSADRSIPAQKARPAPVTTTARTASSRASVRKNSWSSRAIVRSNALSWSGRLSVSVATPASSTATSSVS